MKNIKNQFQCGFLKYQKITRKLYLLIFFLFISIDTNAQIESNFVSGKDYSFSDSSKYAGFRASRILSSYPGNQFPNPSYWNYVGNEMKNKYSGYQAGGILIVSLYLSNPLGYTLLNFPSPGGSYPWIYFKNTDENESYLDYFDSTGVKVWLQVEPGGADIDTLIHIVLNRYQHHSCVIGFGIDVEWYQTYNYPGGRQVTDAEANRWEQKVKSFNPNYTLFLKHYGQSWMPPSYRGDLIFIDDSQDFTWSGNPLNAMKTEFQSWGAQFSPNPVGYQIGYPADRVWWSSYTDPPLTIGNTLINNISNCAGIFWVDFTINEIFPITAIYDDIYSPSSFQLLQNYPNPFNNSTIIEFHLERNSDVKIYIMNVKGQLIEKFDLPNQPAGLNTFIVEAENFASGIYFYMMKTENISVTKKMILIN